PRQPLRGGFQLPEGAAVIEPITSGQRQLLLQRLLHLSNKPAQIAVAHIHAHHYAALAVFTTDLCRRWCQCDVRDFAQWHKALSTQWHGQKRQRLNVSAQTLRQPDDQSKVAIAVVDLPCLLTTDSSGQKALQFING